MPTVSIRETLARLPGGFKGKARSWSQVSDHLWVNYLKNDEEDRRQKRAAERHRYYLGCCEEDLKAMIRRFYDDPIVREKREKLVEIAAYNLVLRRVIHEQATVYSLPAERVVGHAPAIAPDASDEERAAAEAEQAAFEEQNRRYREVLRLCRFHEVMQRLNALLLLHRAVVIRPRMRELPDGSWVPTIDLFTPACFHAVRDPIDATLCVALIFRTDFQLADQVAMGPTWELLTWHERAWINSSGRVMETDGGVGGEEPRSMIEEHGLGRLPAILATIEPPDGKLLDEVTGCDLVAAQKAATFLQNLMAKEAKSATKQHVVQGDATRMMREQAADTEAPIEATDGVSVTTIDNSMAFLDFERAAKQVGNTAAANHGVAAEVMDQSAPTSADARDLVRVPIRERRLQQQVPFRQIEHDVVELLAVLVAQYRADLAFSADGFNCDFADPQTPLGTSEALDVLRKELDLGLTSELRALMDRNPDLTYAQAKAVLLRLMEDRTFRLEAMKRFMVASGGIPQAAVPPELRPAFATPAPDAPQAVAA